VSIKSIQILFSGGYHREKAMQDNSKNRMPMPAGISFSEMPHGFLCSATCSLKYTREI
jgi:hypothetical protein